MVKFSYGDTSKVLAEEWHALRNEATFETFVIDKEFGPIEKERGDLDELTARRGAKDSTYETDVRIESQGAGQPDVDIRTVDDIRD
jgi:hypothetical protein